MDQLYTGGVSYPFLDQAHVNGFVGQNCIQLNPDTLRSANIGATSAFGQMSVNPEGLINNTLPVINGINSGLYQMKTIYNSPPPVLCETPDLTIARLESARQTGDMIDFGQLGGINTTIYDYQNLDRYGGKEVYTPSGYNPRQPPPQIGQKRSYEQMMQSSTGHQSTPFTTNVGRWLSETNGLVTADTNCSDFHALKLSNGTSPLHCTLCNVTCLDIETFEIHKQSKQHLSRASGQTTDALINRFNKTTEQTSTEPFCKICNRRYSGTLINHEKGPEHKRKDRLTRRGCVLCQTGPYATYPEYVKHIDSAEHKQQKDALQSEMKERESLGIAVNPAFISKPGPIKASQMVQDALQKGAIPVVSLQESGITFHPPKTVATNLLTNTVNTSCVGYSPSLATSVVNCPGLVTATGNSAMIRNIETYTPTIAKAGFIDQSMSSLGQVRHAEQGQAFGQTTITNTSAGNILSTAMRHGISNFNVPADNNLGASSVSQNNSLVIIQSNTNKIYSSDISLISQNKIHSSPNGRSHSHNNSFIIQPSVSTKITMSSERGTPCSSESSKHDIKPLVSVCQNGVPDDLDKIGNDDEVGTCKNQDNSKPQEYSDDQCTGSDDNYKKASKDDMSEASAMQSKNHDCRNANNSSQNESCTREVEKNASIVMAGNKKEKIVSDQQFVVPVSGYYCSLCDVFYVDSDTPHCQTQRHTDMLKKVKSNGSKKPMQKPLTTINTWIHEQLDRKKPNETLDEDVIETAQTSNTDARTIDDVTTLDTKDEMINLQQTKAFSEPPFNDKTAQDQQSQVKDCNENIST